MMKTETVPVPFPDPKSPYPGWERRTYRLSRPVNGDDIAAFLGDEEMYIRETGGSPVVMIHKYGVLEIHAVVGEREIEVWFSPDQAGWSAEYLDALLMTRF
jgi:hypothetical protein